MKPFSIILCPPGLDILLDLQTEEVLTSYKTGYGMRVVVHEQGTRPFPSSEGFTLSAGFETHFGLRVVRWTAMLFPKLTSSVRPAV